MKQAKIAAYKHASVCTVENGHCQEKPKCRLKSVEMNIQQLCMVKQGQREENMDGGMWQYRSE